MSWMAPFQTLLGGGDRMVRVMARPRFRAGEFVEIVAPDGPLRKELIAQLGRLLGIAVFSSIMAGAVVYLSLNFFLVRPMQRITRSMERFRADPADPDAHIEPSGRRDENRPGRARTGPDAVGPAHRPELAGAARSPWRSGRQDQPRPAPTCSPAPRSPRSAWPSRAIPRSPRPCRGLERALDRAIKLASNVLAFRQERRAAAGEASVALRAALEEAAEDAA